VNLAPIIYRLACSDSSGCHASAEQSRTRQSAISASITSANSSAVATSSKSQMASHFAMARAEMTLSLVHQTDAQPSEQNQEKAAARMTLA
jgi:hypothetical protein